MQRTFFDQPAPQPTGPELRDEAITRVREHADDAWYERALMVIYKLARSLPELTSDQLWLTPDLPPPREPRVAGALMRDAMKRGWLRRTDRTRNSCRRENHARPVRVWESLICRG